MGATVEPKARNRLNVPSVPDVQFDKNFVVTAVCECRFPTLLEIETREPAEEQKHLRKAYPLYQKSRRAIQVAAAKSEIQTQHEFRTRTGDWLVTLRPSAFAIEATRYSNFESFFERFEQVAKIFSKTIDSDFYTRVGLRFINALRPPNGEVRGWVNDALVGPYIDETFGDVSRYQQEVRGFGVGETRYAFRHGYPEDADDSMPPYVLDFDFYLEDVKAGELIPTIRDLHAQNYQFFRWAIGPAALEALGPQRVKPNS